MQTALAVRDVWMIPPTSRVFVIIYFVTMVLGAGGFDWRIALPFIGWVIAYGCACWYFVPRLAKISQAQADARSLMTGRITDATPISPPSSCSRTRSVGRVMPRTPCRNSCRRCTHGGATSRLTTWRTMC